MARTDDLTTDRVNANDAAFIAAPNESNTYETLMNTFDTTTDMAPYTSLNNYEAMELPIEMEEAIKQQDVFVTSNRGMTADMSKLDKAIKSATAMIRGKPIKRPKTSQTPKHHVSTVENGSCYELFEEDIENDYYNSQTSPETHIAVSEFAAYLDKKDFEFFNTEFAKLPKGLIKPTDAALLESNLGKNHYTAIYPYDETRVVLAGPGSDFINACYIEGYPRKRRYIASFGPFAKATEDFKTFWRMVWQEKSDKIVMITNLIENGSFQRKNQFILAQTPLVNPVDDFLTLVLQENCCCIVSMDAADLFDKTICTYVPAENQTLSTDAYEVKSTWLDCNQSYSLRTLTIKSKNPSTTITVQHFMFANWPHSSKTPNCPTEFLTFVKQIQKLSEETTLLSPVLVHCSSGSERSALPCVVLNLLQKIELEHEVSVINTVRQVKVRRSKAIPNKEQFKFCHQCVSAYIQTCDLYYNLI